MTESETAGVKRWREPPLSAGSYSNSSTICACWWISAIEIRPSKWKLRSMPMRAYVTTMPKSTTAVASLNRFSPCARMVSRFGAAVSLKMSSAAVLSAALISAAKRKAAAAGTASR